MVQKIKSNLCDFLEFIHKPFLVLLIDVFVRYLKRRSIVKMKANKIQRKEKDEHTFNYFLSTC